MDSPTPSMPNLNPQMPQQQMQGTTSSHTGLIIASVAVALLVVAGGIYYWMFWQNNTSDTTPPPSQVQNQQAPVVDSTSAIEADLGSTEDINLDAEFKDIDADLKTL